MISTKRLLNKLPLAAIVLALFSVTQTANAGLILRLDDGFSPIETIYDQDFVPSTGTSADVMVAPGVVGFVGSLGVWGINVSTGFGSPNIGTPLFPEIDLFSGNISSGGAGTLEIKLTQTGNTPSSAVTNLLMELGGTTNGTISQSYCLGTTLFGCELGSGPSSGLLGPGAFAFTSAVSLATPGLYDMTVITSITHTAAGQITSFDANLTAVPEPGMLTLLGLGLLGIGAASRRRKIA